MSAGMADIIAAHGSSTIHSPTVVRESQRDSAWCACGHRVTVPWGELAEGQFDTVPLLVRRHAAHVVDELTRAGYGNVQEALVAAADAMPIETLEGADKASVWLRQRAHANDPEGRALVQAIPNRKAGG